MNQNIGILGRKVGMSQIYDPQGRAVPVTAIEAGPCVVLQVRTPERDKYSAIQLGFRDRPPRAVPDEILKKAQGKRGEYDLRYERVAQPERGHFFKAETAPKYYVRELRLPPEEAQKYKVGQTLDVASIFEVGKHVDVVGTSKGRGFTGVIKRHGFTKFGNSHGTHQYRRHAGSIGCRKPQHTRKGTRMAGQHGNARITVQNLVVAAILPEQHTILLRGGVPGPNGAYLTLRKALKRI
jgi:large subunit ribosomal protein L3